MNCAACLRTNLPGGVRCVYCGTHFPKLLDFEMTTPVAGETATNSQTVSPSANRTAKSSKRGVFGTLAILALKAKSLLVMLKVSKLLLTFGSMFIYIAVYSRIFGWRFATGLAICIFLHEMGHVTVNWMKGLKATAPMFIPFVGALIFIKQFPNDPKIQSESGAGGPAAGLLAALGCYGVGLASGNPFWFALAGFGAFINLFNMVPFPPLDGSHMSTVFSPRIWTTVLVSLLLISVKIGFSGAGGHYNVLLLFILVVGFIFRIGKATDSRHLLAAHAVRVRMAFVFVGLCVGLTLVGAVSTMALSRAQTRIHADASDSRILRQLASQAEETADTLPEAPQRISAVVGSSIGVSVLTAAALGVTCILWMLTSYLVFLAAGRSTRLVLIPIATTICFAGLFAAMVGADVNSQIYIAMTGGMLAASAAAVVYAGYGLANKIQLGASGPTLMMVHVVAWAAGAGLIVAYATDSLPVFTVVTLMSVAFCLLDRWLAPLAVAHSFSALGRSGPAIIWFQRSIAQRPPADAMAVVYHQLIALELRLSQGEHALSSLDALRVYAPDEHVSIHSLWLRSSALMLLDRYDECLSCIEQLLQIQGSDPGSHSRLLLAHFRLAEMTRLRGWHDECISQVERALLRTTKVNRNVQAALYLIRAHALLGLGDVDAAQIAHTQALDASKEAAVQERAASVLAAICIAQGNARHALGIVEVALNESEGDLEIQYNHAAALSACGMHTAAKQKLQGLASNYPREHWGRAAASMLV